MKNILVTGCAGFIGFHTTYKLLEMGYNVIGIDILNNYYNIEITNDTSLDDLKNILNNDMLINIVINHVYDYLINKYLYFCYLHSSFISSLLSQLSF